MKSPQIFKKVDAQIFKLLGNLKTSNEYAQIEASFASLDESSKDQIKRVSLILLIIFPLFVLSFVKSGNDKLKKELLLKKNIIAYSSEILKDSILINTESRRIFGNRPIPNQNEFVAYLTQNLNTSQIDISKIQNSNFELQTLDGEIQLAKLTLKFGQFSNEEIFTMLSGIVGVGKMKIAELKIEKNPTSKMLDGQTTIYYFFKEQIQEAI